MPARKLQPRAAEGGGWAVKMKAPDMKRWEFPGASGRLTTRRIPAQTGTKDRAKQAAANIARKHPGVQAKAVRL